VNAYGLEQRIIVAGLRKPSLSFFFFAFCFHMYCVMNDVLSFGKKTV